MTDNRVEGFDLEAEVAKVDETMTAQKADEIRESLGVSLRAASVALELIARDVEAGRPLRQDTSTALRSAAHIAKVVGKLLS